VLNVDVNAKQAILKKVVNALVLPARMQGEKSEKESSILGYKKS
jgi:hypothetical protein